MDYRGNNRIYLFFSYFDEVLCFSSDNHLVMNDG